MSLLIQPSYMHRLSPWSTVEQASPTIRSLRKREIQLVRRVQNENGAWYLTHILWFTELSIVRSKGRRNSSASRSPSPFPPPDHDLYASPPDHTTLTLDSSKTPEENQEEGESGEHSGRPDTAG